MAAYLPQHAGYLPYYLMYGSVAAVLHSIATYTSPLSSLKQFSGPSAPLPSANPASATLLAHVYGIKNTYTALIRIYAAYHIDNPQLYNLALWSFIGVLLLYAGEFFIWQTVRLREGMFPFVTAGLGLFWMVSQRGFYLEG